MKKKCTTALTLAGLLVVGNGFFRSAYSYKLLFIMPPILAGGQQSTGNGNVVGWQPLNDTGITWSGNYESGNNTACVASTTPDGDNVVATQDCSHGRDTTHNDDSDGHAGFSYTKLDSNGTPLANQNADYATTPWACVKDNVTGLIWEVKTDDGGLHDKDDQYNQYSADSATNGYVTQVNATGLCGASDWRMPNRKELLSIVHYGISSPAIDTSYFPNTVTSDVWSGSPVAYNLAYAWSVDFNYGVSYAYPRNDTYAVRLVRSGQ